MFAPTNAAFDAAAAALGLGNGSALVAALPAAELAKVLQYHVVAGSQPASALSTGPLDSLYSFGGAAATLAIDTSTGVRITDEVLTVANVTTADLRASNGIIQVIDKLLVPPGVLNVCRWRSSIRTSASWWPPWCKPAS